MAKGRMVFSRISTYWWQSMVPCMRRSGPIPWGEKLPFTMANLPLCFILVGLVLRVVSGTDGTHHIFHTIKSEQIVHGSTRDASTNGYLVGQRRWSPGSCRRRCMVRKDGNGYKGVDMSAAMAGTERRRSSRGAQTMLRSVMRTQK